MSPPAPRLSYIFKVMWTVFCVPLRSGCRGSQKQTGKCKWLQLHQDILHNLLWPQWESSWLTRWIYLLQNQCETVSSSQRSRGRDYPIYHCQWYHATHKAKKLHLLAVAISLYFDIRINTISSKMYLYWPAETSTISRPTYSNIFSCFLFLFSKWHFGLIALLQSLSEIITAVDCMPQEVSSENWQVCLSLNLLPTCRVHVVHPLG